MKRAALICLLVCVVTPSMGVNTANNGLEMATTVARDHYHPAAVQKPRLIEQFDKRYDDGHYEYSYTLSNGDKRYEHAYWQPVGNNNILARKGYYSYPLPNSKCVTVFYTSDQNGFQQEFSSYSNAQPNLPRTIDVPQQVPMKPMPVYAASNVAHSNSQTTASHPHHAAISVSHVSSTSPPVYQHSSPQEVASPPNYILTSVGHHPWQSQGSYQQTNRLRRHNTAHSEGEDKHDTTTHSPKHTKSSTSHSEHQKHETHNKISSTTPIPVSTTQTLQSSSSSTGGGRPGVPSHAQPSAHSQSIDSGHVGSIPTSSVGVDHTGFLSQYQQIPNDINNLGVISHYQPLSHRVTDGISDVPTQQQQAHVYPQGSTNIAQQSVAAQTFTGHGIHGGHHPNQPQPNVNNQEYQNALLTYIASRVSAESPESHSSSESHEIYLPGIIGTAGHGGQTRRSGNRPIWRNEPATHPYTTFAF